MTEPEIKVKAERVVSTMALVMNNIFVKEVSNMTDEEKEIFFKYYCAAFGNLMNVISEGSEDAPSFQEFGDMVDTFTDEVYGSNE